MTILAHDNIEVRLATEADLPALLTFVAKMGFNPRSDRTWRGLSMGAMTAWNGSRLIGAAPFEPRILQAGGGRVARVLHETVVAVHPDYRATGVGSRLQGALADAKLLGGLAAWATRTRLSSIARDLLTAPSIKDMGGTPLPPNTPTRAPGMPPGGLPLAEGAMQSSDQCAAGPDLLTVFREDPASPAYRWYLKCGFTPILRIESFFADDPQEIAAGEYRLIPHDSPEVNHAAIASAWEQTHGSAGGPVSRRHRPIGPWLDLHPYAGRYRFFWVLGPGGWSAGHVLLGVGRMHSTAERADVLQLAGDAEMLVCLAARACADNGWTPLRWPVAAGGTDAEIARRLGMNSRWTFDMLGKALGSGVMPDTIAWQYSGLDFA